MVFSSIPFLYYFLPLVLVTYFAVPQKLKNSVLLLFSLIFYAWGEPRFVFCMLFIIIIDFISALFIERYRNKNTGYSKAVLIGALVINIGLLGYFKYFTFCYTCIIITPERTKHQTERRCPYEDRQEDRGHAGRIL